MSKAKAQSRSRWIRIPRDSAETAIAECNRAIELVLLAGAESDEDAACLFRALERITTARETLLIGAGVKLDLGHGYGDL